ncbi:hypothetical protein [Rhodohalobacter mucosus]|uniref:Anti-sigma-28 factor FlgM C-terminal domain-containing protein n=1 Tax=Rhodohalobacter mucosus TaxID=2079485 RepID=A0A316TZ09_9BACT|nr:hypothetical protein [Rhodohalobacter mucosus]PWN05206.1 hypothetical protein DDZ15_15895 [Rhodohalobacter mucosus]
MSINNISSSGLSGKPVKGTDKADKPAGVNDASQNTSASSSRRSAAVDRVEISGKEFTDSVEFAKNVYRTENAQRVDKLQSIRKKMNAGFYESEAVVNQMSTKLAGQLRSLEASLLAPENSNAGKTDSKQITAEQMTRLANDPDVANSVADKIARDLDNL